MVTYLKCVDVCCSPWYASVSVDETRFEQMVCGGGMLHSMVSFDITGDRRALGWTYNGDVVVMYPKVRKRNSKLAKTRVQRSETDLKGRRGKLTVLSDSSRIYNPGNRPGDGGTIIPNRFRNRKLKVRRCRCRSLALSSFAMPCRRSDDGRQLSASGGSATTRRVDSAIPACNASRAPTDAVSRLSRRGKILILRRIVSRRFGIRRPIRRSRGSRRRPRRLLIRRGGIPRRNAPRRLGSAPVAVVEETSRPTTD